MASRVVLITGSGTYVGPALARRLARSGCDLVLCGARPGQREELEQAGSAVHVLENDHEGVTPDGSAAGWQRIVSDTLARFGRLDAAALFPPPLVGVGFTRGPFLDATVGQVREMSGYLETTLLALQAVIPPLRKRGGQIVVFTSDAGARPATGWSIYGAARAAQNFLVRAVALEHARDGICINAIGSKNAVFPGFPGAPPEAVSDGHVLRGDWSAALEAETPLGRVGTMEELAAFSASLLDGDNRFQTAQYFSFSGGWNCA